MQIKNTHEQYGSAAKFFHWLTFLIIAMMLTIGFVMTDLDNGPDKFWVYGLHKSVGTTLLFIVLCRLAWKAANIAPKLPDHMKAIEKMAAQAGHIGLYLLIIAMPLSGWMMSSAAGFPVSVFGYFTLPDLVSPDRKLMKDLQDLHEVLAYCIIGIVSLHVVAALLHHFYHKDNVLRRMLPFVKVKGDDHA